eukprot:TRINITY_DN19124_c0_g1_i1.p1 TRINITY_DN19124_c0_g1~~TRINITY_DN19124_c0_g1_i1.p1  ORF type:complete len:694 (+),score=136.85 TRINITY_DN19124_c0_g1_i1:61-2142(+)
MQAPGERGCGGEGPAARLNRSRGRAAERRGELREAERRRREQLLQGAAVADEERARLCTAKLRDARGAATAEMRGESGARDSLLRQMARKERMCGALSVRHWLPALPEDLPPACTECAARGRDAQGCWWGLEVRGRNADGTYNAVARDGQGGMRPWPSTHISNIQVRRPQQRARRGQTLRVVFPPPGCTSCGAQRHPLPAEVAAAVAAAARAEVVRCAERTDGTLVTLAPGVCAAQAVARLQGRLRVRGIAASSVAALRAAEDEAVCQAAERAAAVAEVCAARQAPGGTAQRLREDADAHHRSRVRFVERAQELLRHAAVARRSRETREEVNMWRPARAADIVPRRGGVLRGLDVHQRWWPITVTRRNADGTYTAIAHDVASGTTRKWESVHLNSMEYRMASNPEVARGATATQRCEVASGAVGRWDGAEETAQERWRENVLWKEHVDRVFYKERAETAVRASLSREAEGGARELLERAAKEGRELRADQLELVQHAAVALLAAAAAQDVDDATVCAVLAVACVEQWAEQERQRLDEEEWAAAALVAAAAVERATLAEIASAKLGATYGAAVVAAATSAAAVNAAFEQFISECALTVLAAAAAADVAGSGVQAVTEDTGGCALGVLAAAAAAEAAAGSIADAEVAGEAGAAAAAADAEEHAAPQQDDRRSSVAGSRRSSRVSAGSRRPSAADG